VAAPLLVPRHPEVYVLILPAMGIVAEIIANNTRKPLFGYRTMVYSLIFLGFMSFIVWAHHMFMTGMGTTMAHSSRRPR
jgi:cytochrome c oxidase subunit 1